MDGFAAYVWPAYGASALIIGGLVAFVWLEGRAAERQSQIGPNADDPLTPEEDLLKD